MSLVSWSRTRLSWHLAVNRHPLRPNKQWSVSSSKQFPNICRHKCTVKQLTWTRPLWPRAPRRCWLHFNPFACQVMPLPGSKDSVHCCIVCVCYEPALAKIVLLTRPPASLCLTALRLMLEENGLVASALQASCAIERAETATFVAVVLNRQSCGWQVRQIATSL